MGNEGVGVGGAVGAWRSEVKGRLSGDPLMCVRVCAADSEKRKEIERKTKTGQLAQVTFDMSPAEMWSFCPPLPQLFLG